MGCCRKILLHNRARSVLCLKWVNPIRIIALLSLALHIAVIIFSSKTEYNLILTVVVVIHLVVVFLLLRECQLSVQYHALLRDKKHP